MNSFIFWSANFEHFSLVNIHPIRSLLFYVGCECCHFDLLKLFVLNLSFLVSAYYISAYWPHIAPFDEQKNLHVCVCVCFVGENFFRVSS